MVPTLGQRQVEEFIYLRALITSEVRLEQEIVRWIGAEPAVMRMLIIEFKTKAVICLADQRFYPYLWP